MIQKILGFAFYVIDQTFSYLFLTYVVKSAV